MTNNPTPADAEQSYYCRVVFKDGKPLLIEKLDPFIPEVIDIGALIDAARKDELETATCIWDSFDGAVRTRAYGWFESGYRKRLAQLSHPEPVHKSDKE